MALPFEVLEKNTSFVRGMVQADGATAIELKEWRSPLTQVSFNNSNRTDDNGTLTVHVRYFPDAEWEVLLDTAGNARTVTLSATGLQSFTIENNFVHSLRFTPTGVTGTLDIFCYQDIPAQGKRTGL